MADSIPAVGEDLRDRTRRHGVEFAAMLDRATGEMVGEIIQGDRRGASLAPHIAAMQPGRGYVQIHTHPGSRAFSPEDAGILVAFEGISAMVVIGRDGTWYVLSRKDGGVVADPAEIIAAWEREWDTLMAF